MYLRVIIAICFGLMLYSCQGDTQRRSDYLVQGVDVSRYQAAVEWEVIAEQDVHFAFVKATEGATHTDTHFQDNWSALKAVGLRRGAYHFYRPRTSPVDQADHFVAQVQMEEGDLPPVLDIEVLDGVAPAILVKNLRTWLVLIQRRYGVQPILYTNLNFYNRYLAGHFDEFPVWIARYSREKPVLACGRDWQFWQYGDRGKLDGVDGYIDFNVFKGDWSALDALTQPTLPALSRLDEYMQ